MKHQKTTIISTAAVLIAITVLLAPSQLTEIVAEEKEGYKSANDIVIKTYFRTNGVVLDSNFQVFKQEKPVSSKQKDFAASNGTPQFSLEGVVNEDRAYLYEAADEAFVNGETRTSYTYGEMDVTIILEKGEIPIRQFNYNKCRVADYQVETLFDKEEGWMGKGFATVDKFKLSCQGYSPENPLMDYLKYTPEVDTISSMDLIEAQEKLNKARENLRQ